jgi:diaminohydroxyphosphoribosylaminopyrimidine deaminase/5-amino-6-(5-phosphoribosylamino)uracil reductase
MVGAVVVSRGGEILGEGYHRRYGEAHAETEALGKAGERARGATLYVTLEPCAHHGNTPPCADAVVAAGIARVVACHGDPDPRTSGRGFDRLRRAGVEVEVGERADDALDLNLHFVLPLVLGRPSVSLKWAMSLDGKIATASGESQWISSPAGRRWALGLRETHDAILVGSGTALADDPRLDRRLGLAPGPITRVVMDRRLRLSPEARLFEQAPERGPVLVYTDSSVAPGDLRPLEEAGATVVALPAVTPAAVVEDLHARGVRSLLVEGGGEIAGAFRDAGLYDRVLVDVAPKLLGGGSQAPGPLGGDGVKRLADAARLDRIRVVRRGGDLIVTGLRTGCLQDLSASVVGS